MGEEGKGAESRRREEGEQEMERSGRRTNIKRDTCSISSGEDELD